MTKKDFIALAEAMRGTEWTESQLQIICAFCRNRNPSFMENRFREFLAGRCGPNGGASKTGGK